MQLTINLTSSNLKLNFQILNFVKFIINCTGNHTIKVQTLLVDAFELKLFAIYYD